MIVKEEEQEEREKQQDLIQFIKLMQEVAKLPEAQREKVACFAQGVIAATVSRKRERQQ